MDKGVKEPNKCCYNSCMFLNKTLFGVRALIILAFTAMSVAVFVPTAQANHNLARNECTQANMDRIFPEGDWTADDQELCRIHGDIDAAVDQCIVDHPTNTTDQDTCINAITPASDGYTGREGTGAPVGSHTSGVGTEVECTAGAVGCFGTSSGENKITERLNEIIAFLSVGVGVIITGSVIVAGIQFTFSGGDPQAKAKAIGRLTNAGIAILLYVFGWAFLNWIVPGGWIG